MEVVSTVLCAEGRIMAAITLDSELRSRLNGLNEQLEVRDENGVVVGHFLPTKAYMALMYELERNRPVDPAEIERAREDYRLHGGMTTAEAIAHLEKVARETPRS
jgi:hypothetical protein